MRAHTLSYRFVAMALVSAVLLPATIVSAHPDALGTRFVSPATGVDSGDCNSNHAPCRTLNYALMQVQSGNAIKLAAGTYDVSGIDVENLLIGKEGVRGGFSAEDHFAIQDAELNPTYVKGVADAYRNNFIAHGFIVVDANGDPLPRIIMAKIAAPTACDAGFVASIYPCHNIDYFAQVRLTDIPGAPTSASEIWGIVDKDDNREYAILGHRNGTAFFDVTNPGTPVLVANISGAASLWREVKAYQVYDPALGKHRAYAYATTEAVGGGLQIFDLTNLPNSVTLVNTLTDFSRSHTLYISNIDYATNSALPGATPYLVIAGSNIAGGAYRLYDLTNPVSPTLVTPPPAGTGYMHDSTSMLITDSRTTQCANGHNPCQVLVDFNETSVDLWDVTDKAAPFRLSTTTYPTATYVHSGWPTNDNKFIVVHDELDELQRGINTQIYTLDVGNLLAPTLTTSYRGTTTSTDHNGYAIGNRYYVSHYKRGLVIFDVSDPRALIEIGSFDTYLSPSANTAGTDGAWGVYPFLTSGTLLVSDIENGMFLLKKNETLPPPTPVATNPPPPPTTGGGKPLGGGGGGGALDFGVLILLTGFAMVRARRNAQ